MWWNFVGRSHDEVVAFRAEWQAQITDGRGGRGGTASDVADGRFGVVVVGDHLPPDPGAGACRTSGSRSAARACLL